MADNKGQRWATPPHDGPVVETVEMHTVGEPLRIVKYEFPELAAFETLLEKRRYILKHLDHVRSSIMLEPRGHHEMFGAILLEPDEGHEDRNGEKADMAVIFIHNEGYASMCGHGVICLGRFAVDYGFVKNPTVPETVVDIQAPCGIIRAFVDYDGKRTGKVRFHSVCAFVYKRDVEIEVEGFGFGEKVKVDISFGGSFFAFIPAKTLGVDIRKSPMKVLQAAATAVSNGVRAVLTPQHPAGADLSYLFGTILTCGDDCWREKAPPAVNCTIFADAEIDRSPCGSGTSARVALQVAKGEMALGQKRVYEAAGTGSQFTAGAIKTAEFHGYPGVIVEVEGQSYYSGTATYSYESHDPFKDGFLVK